MAERGTIFALHAEEVSKSFDLRPVIRPMTFAVDRGETLGITGPNGIGKSTLIGLISSLIEPTRGRVYRVQRGQEISEDDFPSTSGIVAPYLTLYPEYTPRETVRLMAGLRATETHSERATDIADRLGIVDRFDDRIGTFSSGMKQRIKYIIALMHDPMFLFLDEPMSNLDERGKEEVARLIQEDRSERVTIIATNEKSDLHLCTSLIQLTGT